MFFANLTIGQNCHYYFTKISIICNITQHLSTKGHSGLVFCFFPPKLLASPMSVATSETPRDGPVPSANSKPPQKPPPHILRGLTSHISSFPYSVLLEILVPVIIKRVLHLTSSRDSMTSEKAQLGRQVALSLKPTAQSPGTLSQVTWARPPHPLTVLT